MALYECVSENFHNTEKISIIAYFLLQRSFDRLKYLNMTVRLGKHKLLPAAVKESKKINTVKPLISGHLQITGKSQKIGQN